MPSIVSHSDWQDHPPLGHDGDGVRRNAAPGDTIRFSDIELVAVEIRGAGGEGVGDSIVVAVSVPGEAGVHTLAEGSAQTFGDYRIAAVAIRAAENELGRGLAELEIAVTSSLPETLRLSAAAGRPADRLRVPHEITHITLHHSGSAEPLRPEDDPVEKLRNLQLWGETDRGWWDVPYHFLIGLDGTIFEGRAYRYAGETNTRYDPRGHLLISVLGNYNLQEPTPEQIEAIANLMTWSAAEFGVSTDNIRGHSDLAATSCPGDHLRKYLEDGTFKRLVREKLAHSNRPRQQHNE